MALEFTLSNLLLVFFQLILLGLQAIITVANLFSFLKICPSPSSPCQVSQVYLHIPCSFVLRLLQFRSLLPLLWVSHLLLPFQFWNSDLSHSFHFSFLSFCFLCSCSNWDDSLLRMPTISSGCCRQPFKGIYAPLSLWFFSFVLRYFVMLPCCF